MIGNNRKKIKKTKMGNQFTRFFSSSSSSSSESNNIGFVQEETISPPPPPPPQRTPLSKESKEAICRFVETLLQQETMNAKYIPDAMEKQIYMALLLRLFSTTQHVLQQQEWVILNHRVRLTFEPISSSTKKEKYEK